MFLLEKCKRNIIQETYGYALPIALSTTIVCRPNVLRFFTVIDKHTKYNLYNFFFQKEPSHTQKYQKYQSLRLSSALLLLFFVFVHKRDCAPVLHLRIETLFRRIPSCRRLSKLYTRQYLKTII